MIPNPTRPGAAYLAGAPLLIAHRGGAALAPENTMLAFERAVTWWRADVLELDVQPTRDGEVVVFHDSTLDRTTDASGPVVERTLADLREVDAGCRFVPEGETEPPFRGRGVGIPTLGEVLDAFPRMRINVEIKDPRAQPAVWRAVRERGAFGRVLVAAGKLAARSSFGGYPGATSAAEEEIRRFYLLHRLRLARLFRPGIDALQIPMRHGRLEVARARLVEDAHACNVAVHVWTVDETADMHALLDRGVDGIVTDRPDRLARVLTERTGRPSPPGPPTPLPEPFLERLLRP